MDTMKEPVYESPACSKLQVELRSCVLDASTEDYDVRPIDDPFDERE